MTATTLAPPAVRSWTTDLAALLRLDAVVCAGTGLLAVAAAATVADALGPDVPTTAVRWVGVALVVWAVDAAVLARGSRRVVRRTALAAGLANSCGRWRRSCSSRSGRSRSSGPAWRSRSPRSSAGSASCSCGP